MGCFLVEKGFDLLVEVVFELIFVGYDLELVIVGEGDVYGVF